MAWLGAQYGPALMGRLPALFFSGALVAQALADLLPVDRAVAWLLSLFKREDQEGQQSSTQGQVRPVVRPQWGTPTVPQRQGVQEVRFPEDVTNPYLAAIGG